MMWYEEVVGTFARDSVVSQRRDDSETNPRPVSQRFLSKSVRERS